MQKHFIESIMPQNSERKFIVKTVNPIPSGFGGILTIFLHNTCPTETHYMCQKVTHMVFWLYSEFAIVDCSLQNVYFGSNFNSAKPLCDQPVVISVP